MNKTEKALLGIILFAIDFVLTGYATCYIWNAVIAAIFSVKTIRFWQGYAISFALKYFLPKCREKGDEIEGLFTDIVYTSITWLFIFGIVKFFGI
jgi:hypothetical protein